MKRRTVYHSLQYVRAVAAIMVVVFHSILAFVVAHGSRGTWLPWVGASGVDIFFVLSGFVIWLSSGRKDIRPLDFYRKRIQRIAPTYWVVTCALIAVAFAVPSFLRTVRLEGSHIVASLLFVPWRNPGVTAGTFRDAMVPVLVPGWSLNYEVYFYLLFGIALFAPVRRRAYAAIGIVAVVTLLCAAFQSHSEILQFYASPRVGEFLAGVVIAYDIQNHKTKPPLGVALALLVVACPGLLLAERYGDYTILVGLAAATIIYALASLERTGRVPFWPTFELLGDASYSLYLTHIFVVGALRVIFDRVGILGFGAGIAQLVFVLACVILSLLVGVIVYKFVELPMLEAFRARRPRPLQAGGVP